MGSAYQCYPQQMNLTDALPTLHLFSTPDSRLPTPNSRLLQQV
ncbi:hypothetical protein BJP36_38460 [Moorena producens JHB]|uniref:Uncharacterized protein n=1 Tax=Moorena producens (strain JHB) TaxID=1454205 RepID=A0A9Q9UWK9_MOOP1|nr:hypothetical protein BJP36_38460 [Moorena producens JHB]